MPSEKRPSKKQRELLSFIDGFIAGHGYGPSYREIMRALNYKSVSTVAVHVNGLISKGHLIKRDRSARSLEVLKQNTSPETDLSNVTSTDEKWLVDQITQRFDAYEKHPNSKRYDELCILVAALSVLDMKEAVLSFKPRLKHPK